MVLPLDSSSGWVLGMLSLLYNYTPACGSDFPMFQFSQLCEENKFLQGKSTGRRRLPWAWYDFRPWSADEGKEDEPPQPRHICSYIKLMIQSLKWDQKSSKDAFIFAIGQF